MLFFTSAFEGAARAQDSRDDSVSGQAADGHSLGASNDPNLDRGFLLSTAMTQPAGTITYNNYELLLHGITYGLTDRVQLSAMVLAPITEDMPFFGSVSAKGRLLDADRLHLALQGSVGYGRLFGADDDEALLSAGTGVLASLCLRDDCASLLSASATYQLMFSTDQGDATRLHLVIYGVSLVQRLGGNVKLLAELTSASAHVSGDTQGFDNAPGLLVSYGLRFHGRSMAGDVGFMKPVSTDEDTDVGLVMGLPFVNLSYRW